MSGWIKLHRKIKNSAIYRDSNMLSVFVHLLLTAQHDRREDFVGGKVIILEPGQLITGRKKLAIDLGISEMVIRRCLSGLEKLEIINQQTTNLCTIITIKKWSEYQGEQPASNQQTTSEQPTSNQRTTTIQELKNDKNVRMEEDIIPNVFQTLQAAPAPESKARPDITELIEYLKSRMELPALDGTIQGNRRYCKLLIDKAKKMIAEDGADGITPVEAIKSIIDLAAENDFWSKQVTGMEVMYRKFVQLGQIRKSVPLVVDASKGADNGFCS